VAASVSFVVLTICVCFIRQRRKSRSGLSTNDSIGYFLSTLASATKTTLKLLSAAHVSTIGRAVLSSWLS